MSSQFFKRAAFAVLALGGVALLVVGCGSLKQQPLAPSVAPIQTGGSAIANHGPSLIVFSTREMTTAQVLRAGKATGQTINQSASGYCAIANGLSLGVAFDAPPADSLIHVANASFVVAPQSASWDTTIIMTVTSGSTLEDVAAIFEPTGMRFTPAATLTINGVGPIDANHIRAYHIEGQDVQTIGVQLTVDGNSWQLVVSVPGFSSYSIDDDLLPPEAGP